MNMMGGRSGLVVKGGDSYQKVVSSNHGYTRWTFFTLICCKNCNVRLKRLKINGKEAGVGPFVKKR